MNDTGLPPILDDLSVGSDAAKLLNSYFNDTKHGLPRFSGSRFNTIGHSDTSETSNQITAEDIAALLCLGVNLKGNAVVALLEDKRSAIAEFLSKIPSDVDLWDDSEVNIENEDSPADQLWDRLREIPDIGPVKASKLMARKRPRLIPIYDQWIKEALGLGGSAGYWTKYRNLMLTAGEDGPPLHQRLQTLVSSLDIPQSTTPLRACDVILWYSRNPSQESIRQDMSLRGGW